MNFDLISLFTGVGGLSLGAWLASKRIKLSNGLTVVSETQPRVKKNSFVKESRDLVNQIAYAGVECHAVKSICYKSKWTSEYDSDITCTLLVYSTRSFEFELFINKLDVIKTLISFVDGSFIIDSTILDTPSIHKDIILHLESILGQIKAETEFSKNRLQNMLQLKRNIRLWYANADEAISLYPKYKHIFKRFNHDGKYKDFQGRFIFESETKSINDIINKFPDADLVEIFNTQTEQYDVFDIKAAVDTFVF